MKQSSLLKTAFRACGVELKRPAFGLDLTEDLKSLNEKQPFEIILDIGANEGQSATALHGFFPSARIFSAEPASGPYATLEKSAAAIPAITPIRSAVGSSEGTTRLQVTGASVNSSILNYCKADGTDRVRSEEEVPLRTVTGICGEHSLETVDLLKIDTQGFDLEVLRGAESLLTGHRVRCILAEVLCVQMYEGQAWFHDILTYLAGFGIQFCGLYDVNRESDPFVQWADALFIDPRFPA